MILSYQQGLLLLAALSGFSAVAIGAFGAHALKQRLDLEMLAIFEVGCRYHMYHALAIGLAALWTASTASSIWALAAGCFFFAGILIFSGSLYLLALTSIKAWGAVTPIGGFLFLAGWLCLAASAFNRQ
jgi:uncharacterized membrane protein YgdD (TMEM256/DUF423 family)